MDRIIYEWDDREARAFFEYAGYRASNLREPLKRAGSRLLHHINMTFATEGEWVGEPWEPLTTEYAIRKMRKIGARPMLVYTGEMRRAALSEGRIHITGGKDFGSVHYYMRVPKYADYQQDGTTRMVARPFVVETMELTDEIEQVFAEWLDEIKGVNVRRSGLNLLNPFSM